MFPEKRLSVCFMVYSINIAVVKLSRHLWYFCPTSINGNNPFLTLNDSVAS